MIKTSHATWVALIPMLILTWWFSGIIDNHYEEFYTNKWGHEVFYHGDKFFVTNHSDYTFEEMLGGNNE